jgi:hypothetical protein
MFIFAFSELVLDQIADRHQAYDPIIAHDREMAKSLISHLFHGQMNAFILTRRDDPGHVRYDWICKRSSAIFADRTNDIAFREKAKNVALNVSDDDRANVLRHQQFSYLSHRQLRPSSNYFSALGRENARNRHNRLLKGPQII